MQTVKWEYEFDPYGDNPANLITGERHTITPANGKNFNFFIPKKAPFHRRGVVIRDAATGIGLKEGTDYYLGWRFTEVLLSGAVSPVYGAIVLNDPTKAADVVIDYHTLGGPYTLDDREIAQLLANTTRDPRRTQWTNVTEIPSEFPPVPHRQSTGDLVGFDAMVEVLYKVADAIMAGNVKSMQSLMEHIKDHNNPHKITLADLGIDSLGNLVVATKEEAEGGTDNVHFMSSLRVKQYCDANVVPLLNAHEADTSNPHRVTKSQVGLGNVLDYTIASSLEAQAGVATNRYMTPALTTVLLNALAPEAIKFHTDDRANPHQVTKTQVGLGKVPNYAKATLEIALEGVADDAFMTPYLTAKMMQSGGNQDLSAHLLDHNNPHEVTKAQVGLGNVDNYLSASAQDMRTLTGDTKFVTTSALKSFFDENGGAETFITKRLVKLDRVPNIGIATDSDIANQSNQAFATPATVAQMMSGGSVLYSPIVTSMTFDPATFNAIPFPTMNASEDFGMERSKLGFGVFYNLSTEEKNSYCFTEYDRTGASNYTAAFAHIKPAFNNGFALFSTMDANGNSYRFGVTIGKSKMSMAMFNDGIQQLFTKNVAIPADLSDSVTIAVNSDLTAKTWSVVLTNAGATYTLSGTLDEFYAAANLTDTASLTTSYSYGPIIEIDATADSTLGTRFSSNYLPSTQGTYVYALGVRKRYTFNGTGWAEEPFTDPDSPDAADTRVNFERFRTYWNFATDELFLAVTSRHLVQFGMSSYIE